MARGSLVLAGMPAIAPEQKKTAAIAEIHVVMRKAINVRAPDWFRYSGEYRLGDTAGAVGQDLPRGR